MKKTAKILAAVLAIAMLMSMLAACGDNGGNEKKEETTAAAEPGNKTENDSPLLGTWENSEYGTAYTFNVDDTGVVTGKDYTINLIYKDKGDVVDIDYTGSTETQTLEYTIKDDVLTLAGIEYTKSK